MRKPDPKKSGTDCLSLCLASFALVRHAILVAQGKEFGVVDLLKSKLDPTLPLKQRNGKLQFCKILGAKLFHTETYQKHVGQGFYID